MSSGYREINAFSAVGEPQSRCAQLRALIESEQLEFLMEAHNGISARIVEEAGFKGIWASGLTLAAQFGVRDNNEASWTQILDMLEFMADATTIPILLDGDTGYGNFNNMRRLVRKAEQRGIAGVCIEDKVFPKANSFIAGERQPLCNIKEFCGKIAAGCDSRNDPDFCIVARVEALIAGWGMEEALRRAEAYRLAGADAVLIHSRLERADEIIGFAERWENRLPLVIVPTKYYSTPTDVFRQAGISVVIWANQLLRAATARMQQIAREIQATQTLSNVEDQIAPLGEIFRLQGADELVSAERHYLQAQRCDASAVILAASRGPGMESMTHQRPKAMVPIAGVPLLRRFVDELKHQQMNDITVIAGYKSEAISDAILMNGIKVVHNQRYETSSELASLLCARDAIGEDTIITYGDLLIRRYILRDLLQSNAEIVIVVDSCLSQDIDRSDLRDLVYCSHPDKRRLFAQQVELRRIVALPEPPIETPSGRWIGMMRIQGAGRTWLLEALDELSQHPDFDALDLTDLLNHLVRRRSVKVLYIHGHWLDVNRPEDLSRASDFLHGLYSPESTA